MEVRVMWEVRAGGSNEPLSGPGKELHQSWKQAMAYVHEYSVPLCKLVACPVLVAEVDSLAFVLSRDVPGYNRDS